MNEVNFYFNREEQIKICSESMNKVLGRRLVEKAMNKVVRALSGELLAILSFSSKFKDEKIFPFVEPIENSLRSEPICLQQTAAFARSLVELIVKKICFSRHIGKNSSLYGNIEKLRNNNIVAPWMISHFHSLRILGNETVHFKEDVSYRPVALTDDDLIAVLVSLLRVASFWNDWEEC